MRKFILTTPYGNQYFIHDDNVIERADMPGTQSGQWRFQYVARTDGFAFGCRSNVSLADLADKRTPVRFARSGNPRFTVADLDHGTTRIWGNTKHHGIGRVDWHPNYSSGSIAP